MSTLTINQIIKLVEKLGGPKEVRKILSGKIIITKQENETRKKPRMLSKQKHLIFSSLSSYEYLTKGIIFTSDDTTRELFYGLVEEKFLELQDSSFLEKDKQEAINEVKSPTMIVQEILFIIKTKILIHNKKSLQWCFLHNNIKYIIDLSRVEERKFMSEVYTMSCLSEEQYKISRVTL